MKLICDKTKPPLAGTITAEYLNGPHKIEIEWSTETFIENGQNKINCATSNDVCRTLARLLADKELYGANPQEKSEVDHWLTYSIGPIASKHDFTNAVRYLNKVLGPVTYLAGKRLTIADFCIFAALYVSKEWQGLLSKNQVPAHLLRWYNLISSTRAVMSVLSALPDEAKSALTPLVSNRQSAEKTVVGQRNQEGKFVDLQGAEMGKVIVRFPPEASGYLHIGHAKAALLNQYYQQAFQGKLIMRFDDTNPAKENVHFEQVILEDLEMLEIKPDLFTHTSNYFDLMIEYCEQLLKEGKAYVDDTEPELMKQQREQKLEGANRNNSVEKNFAMWEEMKKGTVNGQKCCVRAKIDMQSLNGCMRDPTIYRCKNEMHPRTGDKYKVYPTYDFACPIVDAIENVTHVLRTMEYHDRDPQFYWFIEALGLRRPYIWEYSRLSMTNTVLSKRKLTWFVQEGLVDGWDDPRFPTVRGVLRRGMTVEGLKQFIIAQGSSKSVVFMEWDKIWAFNKKVIDPIAPRFTALGMDSLIPVTVRGVKLEPLTVPKHPKNPDVGNKLVWVGPNVLVEDADAKCFKEGENVTFINWGNILIKKINCSNDKIVSVEAEPNLENKDYKKTLKITWLCTSPETSFTPCYCVYFDHIINKGVLAKDEDFKKYIGHETRVEIEMLGDPELMNVKKGDIIQLQRRGFFKVDVAYQKGDEFTFKDQPIILFHVPDGHTKENPMAVIKKPSPVTQKLTPQENKKSSSDVNEEIVKQGDTVRNLKTQKAAKADIDAAVKILLNLKAEYKTLTGIEWKPGTVPTVLTAGGEPAANPEELSKKIQAQGDKVRELKVKKAGKPIIDPEVKTLLALKAEYKNRMGKDWAPDTEPVKVKTELVDENTILEKIAEQGNKIRELKAKKSDKTVIEPEVKILMGLKSDYKSLTGKEWKPGMIPTVASPPAETPVTPFVESTSTIQNDVRASNETDILNKIQSQGEKVRVLKAEKAEKTVIAGEVGVLLSLKADYKAITGKEWKHGMVCVDAPTKLSPLETSAIQNNVGTCSEADLLNKIQSQGEKIRQLKAEKADKAVITAEVAVLLSLKSDYKSLTGNDWKPGTPVSAVAVAAETQVETCIGDEIFNKIQAQGNVVRKLKLEKADKAIVDAEVKALLSLKAEYKAATGKDWKPGTVPSSKVINSHASVPNNSRAEKISNSCTGQAPVKTPSKTKESKPAAQKKITKEKRPVDVQEDGGPKKQTRLGLEARKEENLSDWYSQVITKGEMIEYYDVSGCYIFRPWSFAIWESIKDWFDTEIKKLGVQNCYFPIFVSKTVLEKEKTHIADFAPEVAWVTKSGDSEMAEPIAVRPTSETVMYPAYAKWIQSYRDLPLKLNQWNNVVRWEFKHPQPFLRTREFLWQEGHTAYSNKEEADIEVVTILDLYARIYTDLLAIPVVKGRKTEKEKFAGGDYTLTVEAFVSASGRAIQGATSHHLGQNFSKMFDITFEDPDSQEKKFVFQNSWGITTRTIGVMIMIHADNQGLVLPPHVASIQVVIVPCGLTVNLPDTDKNILQEACNLLESDLKKNSIRAKGDYRSNYSPGWKFNHWELKGVPIRIEYGPKDLKNQQFVAVRRDTGEKIIMKRENAVNQISDLLEAIQKNLYDKALADLTNHMVTVHDWSQFGPNLDKKNIILTPFCGESPCEDNIKKDTAREDVEAEPGAPAMGAKSLCIPLEQPAQLKENDKCIHPNCHNKANFYTLFGRSY